MHFFKKIQHFFRIIFLVPLGGIGLWSGSWRTRRWMKKIDTEQDQSLYPFNERWEYIRKKMKSLNKRIGVKIVLEGEENLPKGGCWIVSNHTSNFDAPYIIEALGAKIPLVSIAKDSIDNNRFINGYFRASNSFMLDRKSTRKGVLTLNNAANFAKKNNRGAVLFPEGTRSLTGKLLDFKCGSFKFPQKYGLPIVPVTMLGTLQARNIFSLKQRVVKIKVHKQIKTIEHINTPTEILCKKVWEKINKELIKYDNSLSKKELDNLNKIRKKSVSKENKKNKKLEKELQF